MSWAGSLDLTERDLVAVAFPVGAPWTSIVREAWGTGAALLPIDNRLPDDAVWDLVRLARPTAVVTDDGGSTSARRIADGVPVDERVALVVATSGTTGRPKLVELERRAIEAAVTGSAAALSATGNDGWVLCLSPAHVAGMLVLFRGMLLGAPVEIHPSFDPHPIGAARSRTFISVVPTMLIRLLDAGVDVGAFRAVLVGGAHLRPDVRARAERAGARIVETYGLTESCGGVVYDGTPFDGVGVRVDATGRIELAGPTLMKGYRFEPEETADAFTDDGWLRTRDAGTIDAEGRLRVFGRIDDAITTGGETVWPREVESVIALHPNVAEVTVVGRPDAEWGERVVAVVVPDDPEDPPTLGEIRDLATERLGRYKAPRELEIVTRLPRTAIGKVRRPANPRG